MQKRMLRYIREHQIFRDGDKVIVGLSGGADSVCLLYLLARLREELNIELRAVHVHHGLRGREADRDAAYSEELSSHLKVPFLCVRCDVAEWAAERKLSVEEAGRQLRYRAFEEERKRWGGTKIAVAHHRDDSAETILYNLVRGCGLRGLGGIQPVSGLVVRPLLFFSREEIREWLREMKIPYCEDSTNACLDYARNRLRLDVIPTLCREVNGEAVANILRMGGLAAKADAYLSGAAAEILDKNAVLDEGWIGLPLEVFCGADEVIQRYLVREMAARTGKSLKNFTFVHVESVCGLAGGRTGRRTDLPGGLYAVRTYGQIQIRRKNETKQAPSGLPQLKFKVLSYEDRNKIPKNMCTKWFDYDKINGTLTVRYRMPGDYITLAGGGRKSLKSLMIDEKIPREQRGEVPLLAEGNHILWVIGRRISEYYKITDDTKNVLQVQIDGGENDG